MPFCFKQCNKMCNAFHFEMGRVMPPWVMPFCSEQSIRNENKHQTLLR